MCLYGYVYLCVRKSEIKKHIWPPVCKKNKISCYESTKTVIRFLFLVTLKGKDILVCEGFMKIQPCEMKMHVKHYTAVD